MYCFGVLFCAKTAHSYGNLILLCIQNCDNLCISVLWSCNNKKITYMCIQCMCIYDNVISGTEYNTGLYTNVESG